jgi:ferredoxin
MSARPAARTRRLRIDWTACDGRGLCVELLPELLRSDPWGFPVLGSRDAAEVPPELLAQAERAVDVCPRLALRLEAVAAANPSPRRIAVAQARHTPSTAPATIVES